jgi:hypothetical protein
VQAKMSPAIRTAVHWMSAFGEGEAMLAAVGSTNLHPHWEDDALARARWDGDLMHFNTDLATLQQFFSTFWMAGRKEMTPSKSAPLLSGARFREPGIRWVTKWLF